jgi:hypothetical protein
MNRQVPQNAGKLSSVLTTWGLSSSAQLHRVSVSYALYWMSRADSMAYLVTRFHCDGFFHAGSTFTWALSVISDLVKRIKVVLDDGQV